MKKIFETEVSTGNASGKAGTPSIPFGRGFYQYGGNNGSCGIQFTPSGEPSYKTYKSMKHNKKRLKRKMKKFEEFITEDACATMGNTGGMGAMVAAQPGASPGEQGSTGSGDIGQSLGTYMKSPPNLKKGKKGKKIITSFKNFRP